jgi:hypothetical protein
LLGIIKFRGTTGLFPQNVINVFEGLLEHVSLSLFLCPVVKNGSQGRPILPGI